MIKSTSQPVESTTWEVDPDLQFVATPNTNYEIRGIIFATFHMTVNPRANLKIRMDGPTGAEIRWGSDYTFKEGESVIIGGAPAVFESNAGAMYHSVFSGLVQTNASGGVVSLSYQKEITTPDDIDIESGSFMVAEML